LSVILGLLVRIPYFFIYDFALNDGALFVQMSEAVRLNGYILPETVTYNRTEIPFAYPPLSFYFVAFLTDLFKFNVLDVVRYMPLVFNILSICAFVLLASRLIKNKVILLYTSLFFPLIPRSYEWLIMGGGVTRSVGFFFALIAIYQANRILLKYDIRPFVYCSLFLSVTVLSHLEWGITGIVAVSLLILSKQFNRRGFVLIIALGAVVLITTSPWWITVLIRHGLAPFTAASKTSEWAPLTFESIGESILIIFDDELGMPLSSLAIIGWLLSVARKDWFLPVWLNAIFLTTPRHGPTAAAMPLAILASVGLAQFLIPILVQAAASIKSMFNAVQIVLPLTTSSNTFFQRLLTNHVVVSCVIAVICILLMTQINYTKHTPLIALTGGERSAMAWLKNNTPSEAEFILLTESISWQDDRVAEWFPVLSDRKSLTTAQGLEWLSGNAFRSKVESIKELKHNQASGGNRLARYVESHYDYFQYVAVFIPHINASYGKFIESGQYRIVYDNDSVLVFEKNRRGRSRVSASKFVASDTDKFQDKQFQGFE
jgi:hypothetical protein